MTRNDTVDIYSLRGLNTRRVRRHFVEDSCIAALIFHVITLEAVAAFEVSVLFSSFIELNALFDACAKYTSEVGFEPVLLRVASNIMGRPYDAKIEHTFSRAACTTI